MRLVRPWLVPATLAVAATFLSGFASADEEIPPPSPDGAAYLIVSVPTSFDLALDGEFSFGTQTILVRVGTFTGGGEVLDSRFVLDTIAPFVLPGDGEMSLSDLDGNQVTLFGSFQDAEEVPHVVSPEPDDLLDEDDGIPPDLQAAVFVATQNGALDAMGPYPSTLDIVLAIAAFLPIETSVTLEDVFFHVFGTPQTLTVESGIVTSEGDLFPHEPGAALFNFDLSLEENEEGEVDVTADVCRIVGIDVKPGNADDRINFSSDRGTLKIAILSSDGFDATEVVGESAQIGGVSATGAKVKDANHDGIDDLVVEFSLAELSDEGVVDDCTASLTVRAELEDGTCVEGTDAVESIHGCDDDE